MKESPGANEKCDNSNCGIPHVTFLDIDLELEFLLSLVEYMAVAPPTIEW